jgi:hypothetical protein
MLATKVSNANPVMSAFIPELLDQNNDWLFLALVRGTTKQYHRISCAPRLDYNIVTIAGQGCKKKPSYRNKPWLGPVPSERSRRAGRFASTPGRSFLATRSPVVKKSPPRRTGRADGDQCGPRAGGRRYYGNMISTRRFCGSRTPGAVGTRGSFMPRPVTTISLRGTPRRSRAAATALARRSESRWL